jgi:hypothetical protein
MTYKSKDLSVVAYANGFTSWHYVTDDALTDVEADGYFSGGVADLVREGDTITINAGPRGQQRHAIRFAHAVDRRALTVTLCKPE